MGRLSAFLRLSVLALFAVVPAANAQEKYREPPEQIRRILDAEPLPIVSMSPDKSLLVLMRRPGLPSIEKVAAADLKLAGLRFDPRTNGPTRTFDFTGIQLQAVAGGQPRTVTMSLPAQSTLGNVRWSPAGDRFAFTVTTSDAITLWVANTADAAARQVSPRALNAVLGTPCEWLSSEPALVCTFVPPNRGVPPRAATTPEGPIVQETAGGREERAATYQDLLKSPYDEAVFEYYAMSELAKVSLDGQVTPIGRPALYAGVTPSPDGRYLLQNVLSKPFSYQVPFFYFPTRTEVVSLAGAVVKVLTSRPLVERVPWGGDAAVPGPRSARWRSDVPATLVWLEALDRGDPEVAAAKRDRILMLEAPFSGDGRTLLETTHRAGAITWGGATLAIAREQHSKTRRAKTWIIDPSNPSAAPRLLWDLSSEDRYGNPGFFLTTNDARGQSVLATSADGKSAFLVGQGASPEGDKPFIDRLDLATGKSTRLFQSTAPYYEQPIGLLDASGSRVLTMRESTSEAPNYWIRDLVRRIAPRQLTTFSDPAPQFAGVTSQLVTYTRPDGVQLSATLYLPPGYDKSRDGKLPFFFWAYPLEYRTREAASQVVGSPHRFVRPTGPSHLFLLLQGYGVLDNPTMPILGEKGAEPNDTYVEQLTASAKAAVDKVVELGVADRAKIAVGGHSYGGFMTANLLAHSNLFRAGVARSGAYNRTLTPFGFQGEERTYWDAEEIYNKMSPFNYADSVSSPILLIHGMADDNTGTYPVQSERFYAALKGNGKTARYVQLPAEAHGYRARESIGHTLWETVTWLDRWVKGAAVVVP
ncbi:MAG: prolyl oligopeptidase family serine peptidase [Gemmatimonadaceae bacterium]